MYYVYSLSDPGDNLPFYIGKGKNGRAWVHLNETNDKTDNLRKFNKIQSIKNKGLCPTVEIVCAGYTDECMAYEHEEFLIDFYGRAGYDKNGILTNICKDSRPPHSAGIKKKPETIERIRKANTGKKRTADQKLAMSEKRKNTPLTEKQRAHLRTMSEGNKGKTGYWSGKQQPKELCNKKSAALKGTRIGNENPMFGKTHTTDVKLKISNAGKRPCKENTKQKIKDAAAHAPIAICPHCGTTGKGGGGAMKRWHFNNCKQLTPYTNKTRSNTDGQES